MSGKVRLDGQDVYTWNKDELGKSIGYLPQDVELFEGTLAENIARFDEVDMDRVREACRLAGVDGVIEAFPDGFETEVGADGSFLSGGERQRVALARAVYGKPSFVVLDEPNASLDEEGDAALVRMLKMLRERGTTVVVITHRPSLLSAVEQMMVLIEGRIQKLGPCAEVMAELQPKPAAKPEHRSTSRPKPPSGPSTVVSIPSAGGRL